MSKFAFKRDDTRKRFVVRLEWIPLTDYSRKVRASEVNFESYFQTDNLLSVLCIDNTQALLFLENRTKHLSDEIFKQYLKIIYILAVAFKSVGKLNA